MLDAGAGTGLYATIVPPSCRYVWLDNDPEKLRGYQVRRAANAWCILGDATRIALADRAVDWTLCTHFTHHLTDSELSRFLGELARVTRTGLILEDGIRDDARWLSRTGWSLDRGSHPRTRPQLVEAVSAHFRLEKVEEFTRLHRYVILKATVR